MNIFDNVLNTPAWMTEASCTSIDPDVFYPEKGGLGYAAAKRICRACPVVNECLEYALNNGEDWGIWGGLGPEQRRQLGRKDAA